MMRHFKCNMFPWRSNLARAENWISSTEQIDCMQRARRRRDLFLNSSTVPRRRSLISTVHNWKRYRLDRQPIPLTVPQINLYVLPPAPLISSLNALVGGPDEYNLISISLEGRGGASLRKLLNGKGNIWLKDKRESRGSGCLRLWFTLGIQRQRWGVERSCRHAVGNFHTIITRW